MNWKKLWEQFVVILKLIVKLLGTKNPEENKQMRGPIIVEHATNASLASGESLTFDVKADGRVLHVFFKYTAGGGGSHRVTVLPIAHFSTGKQVTAWPEDSGSTTNYLVQPEQGSFLATGTQSGKAIYVLNDGASSEYRITITASTGGLTNLFLLSELI